MVTSAGGMLWFQPGGPVSAFTMDIMNTHSAISPPPRREGGGQDAPINTGFSEALRSLIPTVVYGKCPNCRHEYMYENWIKAKPVCDFCGVRFERDPGSFLMLLAFNYLIAVFVAGGAAWILIANYGLFDGITWILAVIGVASVLGFYHAAKSLYIWVLWAFGFVHND